MWCAQCRADVAAEVTADNRRIRCAICGTHLETPPGQRLSERSREARQLLERWSAEPAFDPYAPLTTARPLAPLSLPETPDLDDGSETAATAETDEPAHSDELSASELKANELKKSPRRPAGKRSFRLDTSHRAGDPTPNAPSEAEAVADSVLEPVSDRPADPGRQSGRPGRRPTIGRLDDALETDDVAAAPIDEAMNDESAADDPATADRLAARTPRRRRRDRPDASLQGDRRQSLRESGRRMAAPSDRTPHRIDAAHAEEPSQPHFDVQSIVHQAAPRKPNSTSMAGQFLAYAGVLGLTIGTAMVVWGYFGGPPHFTPTGWLITTAGQMLLFLGVVTLVSGGMEQTTDEVSRRIEWLGERLIRIEQASHDHALRGPSIPAERFAEGARIRATDPEALTVDE